MSDLSEQLRTIDPKGEKRVAVLFHRDHPGQEVLTITGESSRVDHLARLLAAEQAEAIAP